MHEDFLHFVYKNRLWNKGTELLTDNTPFEILDTGFHNRDAGPDFFNARIKIDGILWVGNVEIHVNASDWNRHHHTADEAYNNVILHVVYNYDCDIVLPNGYKIPTWEISFPHEVFNRYSDFKVNGKEIACTDYIDMVDDFFVSMWIEKMAVERLEYKSRNVEEFFSRTNGNWLETLYITLARNFGFGINAIPFEQLAIQTPLNVLLHNADNIFILEAILFGQAGFLTKRHNDDYANRLASEYAFQRKKYNLSPIPASLWKRSKMHPANLPDTRIAQFASLIQKFQLMVDSITKGEFDVSYIKNLQISDYWSTHYVLGELSAKCRSPKIGKQTINGIIINTIVPFSYLYGKTNLPDFSSEKLIDTLKSLDAENNREVRAFEPISKIKCENAYYSQALLNLKKNYCDCKKCLSCNLGYQIMKEISKIVG
ncbi:MAG: DUF2851 family protein [Bacteroidales bacterium]|nr:DUF2851 family protein [Bacteroidales bacterium]